MMNMLSYSSFCWPNRISPEQPFYSEHKIRLGQPLKQETKATSCRVPAAAAF